MTLYYHRIRGFHIKSSPNLRVRLKFYVKSTNTSITQIQRILFRDLGSSVLWLALFFSLKIYSRGCMMYSHYSSPISAIKSTAGVMTSPTFMYSPQPIFTPFCASTCSHSRVASEPIGVILGPRFEPSMFA